MATLEVHDHNKGKCGHCGKPAKKRLVISGRLLGRNNYLSCVDCAAMTLVLAEQLLGRDLIKGAKKMR